MNATVGDALQEFIRETRRIENKIARDIQSAFPDMTYADALNYAEIALRDWGQP